jgi:hypothetical protein
MNFPLRDYARQPSFFQDQLTQAPEAQQGQQGAANVIPLGWQPSTLSFVPLNLDANGNLLTSGAGAAAPTQVVLAQSTYQASSGTVSSSGDNVVHTPTSGKSPQVFYYMLNASDANSGPVTVTLRFASGTPITTISLPPGATLARNIGAGQHFLEGAVNDTVIVNLSASGMAVNWSLESLDV